MWNPFKKRRPKAAIELSALGIQALEREHTDWLHKKIVESFQKIAEENKKAGLALSSAPAGVGSTYLHTIPCPNCVTVKGRSK